jgi:general secretion pathway protein I
MWMWTGLAGVFRWRRQRLERLRGRTGGFTLLEVLVAFTILALLMTVLLRIFSDGFRGISAANVHAAATLHAQATLASVGAEIPLTIGEWSGQYDDGLRWRLRIEAYGEPALVIRPRSFLAYRVTASVDDGRRAGVTLSSLRLVGADQMEPDENGNEPPQ